MVVNISKEYVIINIPLGASVSNEQELLSLLKEVVAMLESPEIEDKDLI